jgi:hypothetical protein
MDPIKEFEYEREKRLVSNSSNELLLEAAKAFNPIRPNIHIIFHGWGGL